jgi:biotin transporter BioY
VSDLADRKDLLSQLFVVLLIGLAYQEMIRPVRDWVRAYGVTYSVLVLTAAFFLTSLRFFIGAQLHLVDESITRPRSPIWIMDFMVIAFEMILFIFLGGLTSVNANANAHYDFLEILILILAVDILWVVAQFVLGLLSSKMSRADIPWKWATINLASLLLLGVIYLLGLSPFSTLGLSIIFAVSALAFIFDVFVVDYFNVVKDPKTPLEIV